MKNIVFYGCRNVGMVVLSYIVARGFNVKVIVEDKDVAWLAAALKLPIVTLDTMGDFDLFICCHGKRILDKKYLKEGKMINIHPCLKYKGHNPIKRFIENKDTVGTIDSLYLTEEVDAGKVIYSTGFYTGVISDYQSFYNIALPYYFQTIHQTLQALKL